MVYNAYFCDQFLFSSSALFDSQNRTSASCLSIFYLSHLISTSIHLSFTLLSFFLHPNLCFHCISKNIFVFDTQYYEQLRWTNGMSRYAANWSTTTQIKYTYYVYIFICLFAIFVRFSILFYGLNTTTTNILRQYQQRLAKTTKHQQQS